MKYLYIFHMLQNAIYLVTIVIVLFIHFIGIYLSIWSIKMREDSFREYSDTLLSGFTSLLKYEGKALESKAKKWWRFNGYKIELCVNYTTESFINVKCDMSADNDTGFQELVCISLFVNMITS